MSAIQRSRTAYKEENRAFNSQTLTESSNEIEMCQKVELIMNGTPDPTNTGNYKSTSSSVNYTTKTITLSSSTEAGKFKKGDEVVLYSTTDNSRLSKIKNCVKSVSGSDVELYSVIPTIQGTVVIEKNLIFRVSNVVTYRVDEYGIGRSYDAIAGLSEVEASMGEFLEGKWNRSDYSFTIDNYDKKFDDYMPGGKNYSTFALREVNVYMGFGEDKEKNVLIFSGFTNLNNGVSEEDEKLKFTAYDYSYIYNIPVQLNTFSNTIADPDYRGEPIPVLFGDYTSYGKYVGGVQRPIIPAVLYNWQTVNVQAKLTFNASILGITNTFYITAKTAGTAYNNWQIELIYSNEQKDTAYSPTCTETSLGGGLYKFSVTLYRGKRSNGDLYSSTKWIKDCLVSNSNFNSNWNTYSSSNEPVLYYKNLVLPQREDSYVGDIHDSKIYYTSGGSTSTNGFYKICSNGFNRDNVGSFGVWFNYGDYDTAEDWETNQGYHGGGGPVPVTWDCDNGEAVVRFSGSHTLDTLLKAKMYVFVSGQKIGSNLRTDSDLLMNFSNNTNIVAGVNGINYTYKDQSGNGANGEFIGLPQPLLGGDFPLGGYAKITPFMEKKTVERIRECDNFGSVEYNCSIRVKTTYTAEYSSLFYRFQRVDTIESKNFIFETQIKNETFMLSALGYRKGNTSQKNIAVIGNDNGSLNNKIYVYLDSSDYVCVSYNGILTRASSLPISDITLKTYGLKVVKDSNLIKIYVKNITDGGSYVQTSYAVQPTLSGSVGSLNYCFIGTDKKLPDYNSGGFYGKIGMVRFRVNQIAFQHEYFTQYGINQDSTDVVSIAKKILQFGGVSEDLFDETWDQLVKSKVNQDYNARAYINDVDLKTVDYVVELLIQFGLVLTMKQSNGKMKFSLIWDSLEFYEKTDYRITSYDIELNSLSVERELNQYFNTASATFNYAPSVDDLAYSVGDMYESAAVIRDGNLNIWFKREDKGIGNFEMPNLYITDDVLNLLKQRIANSTPNSEMITCKLSWRHIALQIGDFVILNHGRYVNVPCQVRSIKLDSNGSFIEVKLRSLENINFLDKKRNLEYTPANFDNIGGLQALSTITDRTDGGNV